MTRESRHYRLLIVIIGQFACICAFGCTQITQTELKFLETRELDLPFDDAYKAAMNAMFGMGLSIQHTDKASGIISGQSGDHVQRASTHPLFRGFVNVKKVTLMLTEAEIDVTQLRMKVLVNERQQVDRTLMTRIWQAIEREAMLETRPPEKERFESEAKSKGKGSPASPKHAEKR